MCRKALIDGTEVLIRRPKVPAPVDDGVAAVVAVELLNGGGEGILNRIFAFRHKMALPYS